ESFLHSRDLDMNLVNAQQARRILDRLVGYRLTPLLRNKVGGGLSAGRVQSAALRLVVDRERDIEAFVSQEYWTIEVEFQKGKVKFRARLVGEKPADGGKPKSLDLFNQADVDVVDGALKSASFTVDFMKHKEAKRGPAPPFITSTVQQDAYRKLGFAAEYTMRLAQQLYEGIEVGSEGAVGLITYMRTDSTRVAASAITEARQYIGDNFGKEYVPSRPNSFLRKVKGAQEAHEAIRPTSIGREPSNLKSHLSRDQLCLYELIWKRMVASQMAPALFDTASADITAANGSSYLLRASGSVLKFPGFTALYMEGRDDEEDEARSPLPLLKSGESLKCQGVFPKQHFTQPPPRFTEASLIRALEERGIGRPSTYAPINSTLKQRGYVLRQSGRLFPQKVGLVVADLLRDHFPDVVDLSFTTQMEDRLDSIAQGEMEWLPVISDFYAPFDESVQQAKKSIEKNKVEEEIQEKCAQCGRPLVIKRGRFGPFISCSGYPECSYKRAYSLKLGVRCPQCGGEVVEKRTRRHKTFYGCLSYPECHFASFQRPLPQPCPQCGGLLVSGSRNQARCLKEGHRINLDVLEPVLV
ncbi:MAG: type I DNA topoisomerase, partial [Dehalococcoidia bacterium]|nr:type I DNA topoisomerase [Dehalococcoidia bacterium]